MEERRRALRLAALALGLSLGGAAAACVPSLQGTRLESPRYVLVYRTGEVSVAKHFKVDVEACAKSGPPPESLKVDATMPEHKHGMNYAPTIKSLGDGRYRVDGLLFHMPGSWEIAFDVRPADKPDAETQRLTYDFVVK